MTVRRDWCEEHDRGDLSATDGRCPDCEVRQASWEAARIDVPSTPHPWELIVASGWGPEYCASMILIGVRQDPPHAGARGFWRELDRLMRGELLPDFVDLHPKSGRSRAIGRAAAVRVRLEALLTPEELSTLRTVD